MIDYLKKNKISSIIIAVLLVVSIVFIGLAISNHNKVNNEIKVAYNECDSLLKKQGSNIEELNKLLHNKEYNYKVESQNKILDKVPETYQSVFYDVVKYSGVCEKGLELENGQIASFYYKVLGLDESNIEE